MNKDTNSSLNPHTLESLWQLQKLILSTPDFKDVVTRVVNSILIELGYLKLGYRILVLTLVDKETNSLRRIALSQTPEAQEALNASPIPFQKIAIPLTADNNLLIRTLKEKRPYVTHYWPEIFRPVLSDESALHNQEAAGIKTSLLYPLIVKDEAIGVMIFSMVKDVSEVAPEERLLIDKFVDIVGLAVQNSLLYSSVKEYAEELKKANARLIELNRLKDELISLASHELRTPLASVRNYIWMVLGGTSGPISGQQKLYLERAYISTERLISLVNDMLNVSRIDSGGVSLDVKPTDLPQLAQSVVDELLSHAKEFHVNLVLTPPPAGLPQVSIDPQKIKEVLVNLIGNSIKFTPANGTVTVSFAANGNMVATTIADTGTGIEPADVPKLFQKFGMVKEAYIADRALQGTGLGLYICKAIIEMHKGEIHLHSEGRGKGTQFTFTLPIQVESEK